MAAGAGRENASNTMRDRASNTTSERSGNIVRKRMSDALCVQALILHNGNVEVSENKLYAPAYTACLAKDFL